MKLMKGSKRKQNNKINTKKRIHHEVFERIKITAKKFTMKDMKSLKGLPRIICGYLRESEIYLWLNKI